MQSCICMIAAASASCISRFEVDGLPITVYDENASNPILVSVPGNGGWNYLSPKMSERLGLSKIFTVATYDMRGMAENTEPPTTWDAHVDDVLAITHALRRKYKRPKVCIVGYSTGTFVANTAVTLNPDSFSAVIAMGLLPDYSEEKAQRNMDDKLWENLYIPSWFTKAIRYADYSPWMIQMGSANEIKTNLGISTVLGTPMGDVAPSDPAGQLRLSKSMGAISMPPIRLDKVELKCP